MLPEKMTLSGVSYNPPVNTSSFIIKSDFKEVTTTIIPSKENPVSQQVGALPILKMLSKEGSNIYLSASVSLLGLYLGNPVVTIGGLGLALIYVLRNYLD